MEPAPIVRLSPEGLNDTNGCDRLKAHVSVRFLRAFPCPARIIAAVSPLIPLIAGVVALAIWLVMLRTVGTRHRVGRLLATTPPVSVAEAVALATGLPRYVRIAGRVDAEAEFEDDAHRPLVFRRTRLQLQRNSRWVDLDDQVERVPFEVREGLDSIAVDEAALGEGLVVVVRESIGTAADAPDRVPPGTHPATPMRLRIEQVSSVEHAIVAGTPRTGDDGRPRMTAGAGRPLVLATVDLPDALRILSEGHPLRPVAAAAALVAGLALLSLGLVWTGVDAVT